MLYIVAARIRKLGELHGETVCGGQGLEHPNTFGDYFSADTVAR
jgi:hypothetical protein